ncbi:MAG: hypothetical protein ACO33A_06225 [Hyphomonas sp.]
MTGEEKRLVSERKAVQTVVRQNIGEDRAGEARIEDAELISVILAIGLGLFGPTLSQLPGKPRIGTRAVALKWVEDGLRLG